MKSIMHYLAGITLALISQQVFAYEQINTYELTLDELMDIKVVSASRVEEDQHLAPGIVTVVSEQEIKQYGARHLRDVIDRLVGIQVLGSHQDFHSKTSMRAINSSHHEDTVLILLNGRPMRQATDGGLNSDLYVGFPLNSIKRIEVVRGPGSIIYGTNAMAGVVNIITRDAENSINRNTSALSAGSYGYEQLQLSSLSGDEDYSINLEFNHLSADGDPVDGITDQDNIVGRYETGLRSNNFFINARYKNFTVNGLLMDNNQDSASSAFQLPSNPIDLEREYIDIGYQNDLSSIWNMSINYTHSEDTAQWQINEALGDNFSEGRFQMLESVFHGEISEKTKVILGLSHVKNESGFERGLPQGSKNSNSSAYAQVNYLATPTTNYIAGLQWNDPDSIEGDLSVRVGYIDKFKDNWWVKLLYSEAYRSPNLVETDLDAPQLKGVPDLNPENIATYDIQFIYQTSNNYLAIALYHSKLENLIVRVPGTPTTHANEGYVKFNGIEVEARSSLSKFVDLMSNFSYQENETDSGVENGTFAPKLMFKFGISYNSAKGLRASLFNSYIGESTDLSETNIAPAINPDAEAYNLLTANISIDTGLMWSLGEPDQSIISVYLDNLLDEEIYAPDLNFANRNNTIPHHWGFGTYITYSYSF